MHTNRTIRSTVITVGCAAILAGPAFAGGEPKNEWPFTRQVDLRAAQAATRSTAKPAAMITGEPKNEPPFTRAATMIAQSGSSFSWPDAGIGLIAGIGLAATGAGLLTLKLHKSPQTA
jgi:hypothetical protein